MSKFYGQRITQFPDQVTNDPARGLITRRAWRCTPAAAIEKMNELISLGVRFDHDPGTDGGYQWVVANYSGEAGGQPSNVPLKDVWTMPNNDLEKDIWVNPKVTTELAATLSSGIPTADYFKIKNEVEGILDGSIIISGTPVPGKSALSTLWSGWSDDFKKFVRTLARGSVVGYAVSQYVLRNEKEVASNYGEFTSAAIPAYLYANKILTTTELLTGYNVQPLALRFVVPSTGVWLQGTPQFLEGPRGGTYRIVQEWRHADEYDDFLYDPI